MKLAWRVAAIFVVVAALGCGEGEEQTTPAPTVTNDVPLPEWAPENPSPEFLRAARVLKPVPPEVLSGWTTDLPTGLNQQVLSGVMRLMFPAAYEFFGSFSDEQIQEFLAKKQLRVHMKDLTGAQRQALDRWFEAANTAFSGREDMLVALYKMGAREDLSNVDVGFGVEGHEVGLNFWITIGTDGEGNPIGPVLNNDFASL